MRKKVFHIVGTMETNILGWPKYQYCVNQIYNNATIILTHDINKIAVKLQEQVGKNEETCSNGIFPCVVSDCHMKLKLEHIS
jgi:hypothetical protein